MSTQRLTAAYSLVWSISFRRPASAPTKPWCRVASTAASTPKAAASTPRQAKRPTAGAASCFDSATGRVRKLTPVGAAAPHPVSSVPAGTPLQGLGIYKGAGTPLAKEDSEYPAWLWRLLEPGMGAGRDDTPLQAMRRQLNRQNADNIRAKNFLKNKNK